MNQIKRIIHSTMGKVLVVCAFALTLVGGISVAVDFQAYSSARTTKHELNSPSFEQIDAAPEAIFTVAYGINNHRHIVGFFADAEGTHGFLKTPSGGYTPIDYKDATFTASFTTAFGINDSGQIVGSFIDRNDKSRSYILDNGVFTVLDIPNSTESLARDINNFGQIVGLFIGDNRIIRGYLLDNGPVTPIDYPEADPDIFFRTTYG
jgi:uncharacterized membrane protein